VPFKVFVFVSQFKLFSCIIYFDFISAVDGIAARKLNQTSAFGALVRAQSTSTFD